LSFDKLKVVVKERIAGAGREGAPKKVELRRRNGARISVRATLSALSAA